MPYDSGEVSDLPWHVACFVPFVVWSVPCPWAVNWLGVAGHFPPSSSGQQVQSLPGMFSKGVLFCFAWFQTRKKILDCLIRLDIIRDAARGLVFLHCAHDSPLVHRDVKRFVDILFIHSFRGEIAFSYLHDSFPNMYDSSSKMLDKLTVKVSSSTCRLCSLVF